MPCNGGGALGPSWTAKPWLSLILWGCSSFALLLCCAVSSVHQKWMCCSRSDSLIHSQWRRQANQTGLQALRRRRGKELKTKLTYVVGKCVRLSYWYFCYCVTYSFLFFPCRSDETQEQIAKAGYGLSICVGIQDSTWHSPGQPGLVRPALVRARLDNLWMFLPT